MKKTLISLSKNTKAIGKVSVETRHKEIKTKILGNDGVVLVNLNKPARRTFWVFQQEMGKYHHGKDE